MKLGNFQDLLDKKFTKEELAEIDHEVELELAALKSLQQSVQKLFENYMKQHNLGFNELVRKLNSTPKQVSKIQKGQANLTLASLAMLSAKLGQEPVISFKKK
jgi:transcriptional regulator with XRE-family HTH domain